MDLIVQPADGTAPLLAAITGAEKTIDIVIFRFDVKDIEKALETAVGRGVTIRALIAPTPTRARINGCASSKTGCSRKASASAGRATTLICYHGKLLIVDREALHVYGFNYTAADMKSRSFGLITRDRRLVQEALRLFEADVLRREFEPAVDGFGSSPRQKKPWRWRTGAEPGYAEERSLATARPTCSEA